MGWRRFCAQNENFYMSVYFYFLCFLLLCLNDCFAQNVGIGVPTPSEKLEVAGNIKSTGIIATGSFQLQSGAIANSVMTSDAAGTGTWVNPKTIPGTIAGTAYIAGPVTSSVPVGTTNYEFLGPTAIVSLNGNQRVVMSYTVVLGKTVAGSTTFNLDVGYQLNSTGTVINASALNWITEFPIYTAGEKKSFSISGNLRPAAGIYKIGAVITCSAAGYLNSNDWCNGTYMIINE